MTTETVTVASLLSGAADTCVSAMGTVWSVMTGNPLLTFFLGVSIVSIGFAMFRKARRTAR